MFSFSKYFRYNIAKLTAMIRRVVFHNEMAKWDNYKVSSANSNKFLKDKIFIASYGISNGKKMIVQPITFQQVAIANGCIFIIMNYSSRKRLV